MLKSLFFVTLSLTNCFAFSESEYNSNYDEICEVSHWNDMDETAEKLNNCLSCERIKFISNSDTNDELDECQVRYEMIHQHFFIVCANREYSDC